MLIVLPVINRHEITGEKEDPNISIVNLDLQGILEIQENSETGYADIYYRTGDIIETSYNFILLFEALYNNGLIQMIAVDEVKKISKTMTKSLTKLQL